MAGKILALLLLLSGGGITLYVLYKIALGMLQPIVQKKLAQQMQQEKAQQLQNSLKLHEQADQNKVINSRQNLKK